jgi:hypothetical protein
LGIVRTIYGSFALLARRLGQFEGPAAATEVKHARCNGFTTRGRKRTRARPARSHCIARSNAMSLWFGNGLRRSIRKYWRWLRYKGWTSISATPRASTPGAAAIAKQSKALGHVPLIDRDFRGQHEAKAECAEEVARMKFTAMPEPDDALYELRIMVERVNGDGRMNSAAGSCVCAARSR